MTRPGVGTRNRTVLGVVLVGLSAFLFGRYMRPAPPPLIIQRAANSPLRDAPVDLHAIAKGSGNNRTPTVTASADDDTVYICGARTKKGAPCRRRVHSAGERCFQHKGRTAMVPLEKLTKKPDASKK